MSETQTSHEPAPDELARESADPAHHPDDTDGHDDHAHAGEALGPVDVRAWGALLLGVAAGLLVALCLVITTTLLAPAVS
jgi:hypothetical protein